MLVLLLAIFGLATAYPNMCRCECRLGHYGGGQGFRSKWREFPAPCKPNNVDPSCSNTTCAPHFNGTKCGGGFFATCVEDPGVWPKESVYDYDDSCDVKGCADRCCPNNGTQLVVTDHVRAGFEFALELGGGECTSVNNNSAVEPMVVHERGNTYLLGEIAGEAIVVLRSPDMLVTQRPGPYCQTVFTFVPPGGFPEWAIVLLSAGAGIALLMFFACCYIRRQKKNPYTPIA